MEFTENKAIYMQIADYMFEAILRKEWKSEDRIPSVREMAVNLEVNPNTVMRTYGFLQDREVIFNKRGIGYFVSEKGYKKTMEIKKADFIDQDLPQVFKILDLIDLNIDDLKDLYEKYKKSSQN